MLNKRASGVLLHISSLPSKYGIGCFDECAYAFVDFLKEAGNIIGKYYPFAPQQSAIHHTRVFPPLHLMNILLI
jgi:4-alpha-glucanotransferase